MDINSATSQIGVVQSKLFDTVGDYSLPGGFIFSPNYLQIGAIVLCIFLLILTFGMLQHRFNHWTIKGIMPGLALGIMLTLFLEALLLLGGRTIFTEILGWENPPAPIASALDTTRSRLVDVMGVSDTVPESKAGSSPDVETVVYDYKQLRSKDKDIVQSLICPLE